MHQPAQNPADKSTPEIPVIVFGGFGFSPDILKPLFPNTAIFVDSNELMPSLFDGTTLKKNWVQTVVDKLPSTHTNKPCLCAGWSLGSLIALGLLEHKLFSHAILLGPTLSFCATDRFPYATPQAALISMRRQFKKNPQEVLKNFRATCGLTGEAFISSASHEALLAGLLFLEHCAFEPKKRALHQALCIAGKNDLIIPYAASSATAQALGAEYHEMNGSHVFFLHNHSSCKNIISNFIEAL